LAINKHNILKTISYPGIDICPGDIFLDSTMGGTKDLSGVIPEENRPSADGNVTPYPIAIHASNNAASTFALGAQATIFMMFNPEIQFFISKFELKISDQ